MHFELSDVMNFFLRLKVAYRSLERRQRRFGGSADRVGRML